MYAKRRKEIRNNCFCYRLLTDYLEMNIPRRLRLTMPEVIFLGILSRASSVTNHGISTEVVHEQC